MGTKAEGAVNLGDQVRGDQGLAQGRGSGSGVSECSDLGHILMMSFEEVIFDVGRKVWQTPERSTARAQGLGKMGLCSSGGGVGGPQRPG